ncbi:glycosyltransferase family 2 protein [Pseudarthrobacter sp. J1763]|uniref:glycosyltransferase family 2 protein n=1 Tax=Pseudarthrobacter sp. J1763 TaxID=3420445 RepID=UPI003D2B28B1
MEIARGILTTIFAIVAWPMLLYFLVINTSYLVLIGLASTNFAAYLRRTFFSGERAVAGSPLSLGISVVMPAYNEEMVITTSVRSVLDLRYPDHEVIVVNDGSKDATLQKLIETFSLELDAREVPERIPVRGALRGVWRSNDPAIPLTVVDKENSGRSDSLNAGINISAKDLVVMVDADSLIDPDALLTVSKPFADDPENVVATGGVVRAVNGCRVSAGRVVQVGMPKEMVARIQVVEYLRAFLLGRTGWSQLKALILISGAFGMFRRDVLLEAGGLDPDCIGEDFELVMRIHKKMIDSKRRYRVVFVAEPVSWTEVPPNLTVLARQRRRWHRGLWEVLSQYRGMTLNPRYGRVGMIALPFYWLFELIAPALELSGLILVPLGLWLGLVDPHYALLLLLVSYVYAIFVSLVALVVEEASFHRYTKWRDLWACILAAVVENFGYRQLTAIWRLQGWWAALRGSAAEWGTMTRTGFSDERDAAVTAAEERLSR